VAQNQFGLSRHIPEDVKREVRARCGFGCAVCGATITEYEHFNPDFTDATIHDRERIVLLCPNHHALVTKGVITKEQVEKFNSKPVAKEQGFSKFNHPWFEGIPSLKMGGGPLVSGTTIPIQVKGESIIQFEPPEPGSEIARVSANLRDANGSHFLKIVQNEWRVMSGNWDFKSVGNRYIFNDYSGSPMLRLRMEPPNFIAIEILRTSVGGVPIHITEDSLMIGTNSFSGGILSNCGIGISVG
jgi:hypothetical protein